MGLATQLLEQSFSFCKRSRRPRFLHRLETCFGDKNEAHSFVCELDRLDPKGFADQQQGPYEDVHRFSSTFLAVNSAGSAIKAG